MSKPRAKYLARGCTPEQSAKTKSSANDANTGESAVVRQLDLVDILRTEDVALEGCCGFDTLSRRLKEEGDRVARAVDRSLQLHQLVELACLFERGRKVTLVRAAFQRMPEALPQDLAGELLVRKGNDGHVNTFVVETRRSSNWGNALTTRRVTFVSIIIIHYVYVFVNVCAL